MNGKEEKRRRREIYYFMTFNCSIFAIKYNYFAAKAKVSLTLLELESSVASINMYLINSLIAR